MNVAHQIEALEVPRLSAPPVQGEVESYYVVVAHYLLTRLFEYGSAVLHAEYRRPPAYGGHSTVVLSQTGRTWRCHFFMANIREAGFWIRVYAHAA